MKSRFKVTVKEAGFCVRQALKQFDMPSEHVEWVVDCLVSTSLRGVDTHGIRLLETYQKELLHGRSKPLPNITVNSDFPAALCIDADNALGIVSATFAATRVIKAAKREGAAVASIKASNHFGGAGHYAALVAKAGMVGMCFSNSDALVAAYNGLQKLVGTNPISIVAPGSGSELFYLDMATSQTSYTYIKDSIEKGQKINARCAIDKEGIDSSISDEVYALLPLGGYKGQGLGMAVQVLTAVLTSSKLDHLLSHLYEDPFDTPREISHTIIAINLEAFGDANIIRSNISGLLSVFRNSRSRPGERVIAPGDLEGFNKNDRTVNGIPVDEKTYKFLLQYL